MWTVPESWETEHGELRGGFGFMPSLWEDFQLDTFASKTAEDLNKSWSTIQWIENSILCIGIEKNYPNSYYNFSHNQSKYFAHRFPHPPVVKIIHHLLFPANYFDVPQSGSSHTHQPFAILAPPRKKCSPTAYCS